MKYQFRYMHAISAIALGVSFLASAQVAQDHPELCGKPGTSIPLPPGLSIISDPSEGVAKLRVEGSTSAIMFPGILGEVQQVCRISQDKLIVFGLATPALYNIEIVRPRDGSLLDSFYGFNPVMAPNQHWLVRRKFYPAQATAAEEYLIYDLTQDWAHNRSSGVSRSDMDLVGKVIYPVVRGSEPYYSTNPPPQQAHIFRSDSFYWSPDSQALIFADSVMDKLSIVLVTIDQNETNAHVHSVSDAEACNASPGALPLMLSSAEISLPINEHREVRLTFKTGNSPCHKMLVLQSEDFTPARPEVHVAPHGKPSTPIDR
ncbi:MAG: hypothetical protein ACR2JB_16795 [Bryobacteraceae bacterium]